MNRPLDINRIATLIDALGEVRLGELIVAAGARIEDFVSTMRDDGAMLSTRQILALVHRLKGTCANLGLAGIASRLRQAEDEFASHVALDEPLAPGSRQTASGMITALLACWAETVSELAASYPGLEPGQLRLDHSMGAAKR